MASTPVRPFFTNPDQDRDQDHSALLSPTKARLAALNASQWSEVSTRLAALFAPSPVPKFERNDATLTALLALLRANEAADEERRMLHEARVEELQALEAEEASSSDARAKTVLRQLESSLPADGREVLRDLAASVVVLGVPRTDTVSVGERVVQLTADTFEAQNELRRLTSLQKSFERELGEVRKTIQKFKAEQDDRGAEEMQRQTLAWNREAKVVGMKLAEYNERIGGLEGYKIGELTIEDVVGKELQVEEKQMEVLELERRIMAYHGLPPDIEIARGEYQRANAELLELMKKRDGLFESLVN